MLLTPTTLREMVRHQGARVGASNEQKLRAAVDALATKRYGSASQENLKKLFLSYDKNKDGAADVSEVESLMYDADVDGCRSAFFATCDEWASGVMENVDASGDGKITWDEYRIAARLPKEVAPPPPPPPKEPAPSSGDPDKDFADKIAAAAANAEKGASEGGTLGAEKQAEGSVKPAEGAPAASIASGVEQSSGGEMLVAGGVLALVALLIFKARK